MTNVLEFFVFIVNSKNFAKILERIGKAFETTKFRKKRQKTDTLQSRRVV